MNQHRVYLKKISHLGNEAEIISKGNSHNGTLYKGDKVLTMDPTWMTKNFVKVTDLSGRIYKLESKILTDSH